MGLFSKWPESGHLHCVVVVNDEAAVTKDETRRVSHIHGHTHCASHRDVGSQFVSPVFFHLLKKQPLHFIHHLHPLRLSHVFDGRLSFT